MHGKIKNILKKTALLLTFGLTCITAVSINKTQEVQTAIPITHKSSAISSINEILP